MTLTLRLYPSDYAGLTDFLFSYREELNSLSLAQMSMTEVVLADFFTRWAMKYLMGEKARWAAKQGNKQHNYRLTAPAAVALFEVLPRRIQQNPDRRSFLSALTLALVNANYITFAPICRPVILPTLPVAP